MAFESSHIGFVCMVLLCVMNFVECSHWRFGQISWKVTSGYTVEFTAQLGWRSAFIGSESFSFGDGTSVLLSGTECSTHVTPCPSDTSSTHYHQLLSVTTDIAGEEAALVQYIFTHTYSSASSFTYGLGNCCRLGNLEVGGSQSYNYYGTVSLGNGNTGSPVSSISPILQFPLGVSTTLALDPVDNDGDTVTCRKATATESSISDNSFYTVDSAACTITIGESGTVGDKWAVQIIMETSAGDSVPLDFILEGTDPSLEAPKCNLISSKDANGYYTVSVGSTLIVEMEGSDDDDTSLTVQSVSLPTGASIAPTGSNSEPVTIYFTWMPVTGQEGSFSASVQVTDGDSQSAICIVPILVTVEPTTAPSDSPTPNPTKMPTQDCFDSKCDTCPCDCYTVANCIPETCHEMPGCDQCVGGYWKQSYCHHCIPCDVIEGCLHCTDYLGCQQCGNEYYRALDSSCGIYVCYLL